MLRFAVLTTALLGARASAAEPIALFAKEGVPAGWSVREWNDLAKPVTGADWKIKDGMLQPSGRRGTWLVSAAEYANFTLEFEVKLTERGNSGVALRAPLRGDPAFDGLELQIADLRYNDKAKPAELTAAVYRALAPKKQVYKPTEWNRFLIKLDGPRLQVTLNGEMVQDADLSKLDQPTKKHDGSDAPPVKDRPRKGHLGFQHLSRNNEPIWYRHVKLTVHGD